MNKKSFFLIKWVSYSLISMLAAFVSALLGFRRTGGIEQPASLQEIKSMVESAPIYFICFFIVAGLLAAIMFPPYQKKNR
jgi:hypothetical protein